MQLLLRTKYVQDVLHTMHGHERILSRVTLHLHGKDLGQMLEKQLQKPKMMMAGTTGNV